MGADVFTALFPFKEVKHVDGKVIVENIDGEGAPFDYFGLEKTIYDLTTTSDNQAGDVRKFLELMHMPYIDVMKGLMIRYQHIQELKHG